MSLLKEISDKGAVLEWSPLMSNPNWVALGTKDSAGSGFDDYGGELEIHKLDFSDTKSLSSTCLGKAKASSRFASIAWSEMATNNADYPAGLIAGGMIDGYVHVWDPAKLVNDDPDALIASIEQHQGAIHGLQFNPHKESSHLLASGGSDCEVYVMSLERPDQPNIFIPAPPPNNAKHTADITKVAWNTQVVHILATAAQNGSSYIWDLRQKKAWCELRDPAGGSVADVAWNPDQGLHLVTASGDDKNPVLKLWDLRSSTSLPLATLQGHTEGILSVSWCPTDPSLLLSCGKDNRTMMWDLFSLQPVYDLPSGSGLAGQGEDPSQMGFGGLATSAGQRRYHVSWSKCLPAVASACSFDRRVQFYSLSGARSRTGRAPKWLRRPCGASFGFGGKLASFENQSLVAGDGKKAPPGTLRVKISQVVEDVELVNSCDQFHAALASNDYKSFCDRKAATAESDQDRRVWSLMKVICFEDNAREELLTHLGFDSAIIAAAAEQYVASKRAETPSQVPPPPAAVSSAPSSTSGISPLAISGGSAIDAQAAFGAPPTDARTAQDLFGEADLGEGILPNIQNVDLNSDGSSVPPPPAPTHPPVAAAPPNPVAVAASVPAPSELSPSAAAATAEMVAAAIAGEKAEPTIRKAIVVGNFAAAVDCCLEAGLMAEALLLAQCGDQGLWLKTQAAFFERARNKHPFLTILHAIIKNEMMNLVLASDLYKWRETLALLSTYGKSDEFPAMCEALAGRLETELRDIDSATLCYMCAANVARVVGFWSAELKAANDALGQMDTKALQRYVEKVVVFTQANPTGDLGPECSAYFAEYAALLASQGRLDVAPKYLKGQNISENILIDRIYHATNNKPVGVRPPAFPFEKIVVNVVAAPTSARSAAAAAVAATAGAAAGISAASSSKAQPQVAAAAPASSAGGLPQGWIQLNDAASGRAYYVNTATGVSQWDPPANIGAQPQQQQTGGFPGAGGAARPQQVGGYPGMPGVAQQQPGAYPGAQPQQPQMGGFPGAQPQQPQMGGFPGAHPQQQPGAYPGAQPQQPQMGGFPGAQPQQQPGAYPGAQPQQPQMGGFPAATAPTVGGPMGGPMGGPVGGPAGFGSPKPAGSFASVGAAPVAAAPVAAPAPAVAAPAAAPVVSAELPESVLLLGQIINNMSAVANPAEKKQLQMVSVGYNNLVEKVSASEVAPDVLAKLAQLVSDLTARNFTSASAIQTDLANTVWGQHKEWIKVLKMLIQLAAKK